MKLVRATLETRNFTFDAYGVTEAQALANLNAGWHRHCDQYERADRNLFVNLIEEIQFQSFEEGACYRDDEQIYIDPSRL